jgi:hypothetical protein
MKCKRMIEESTLIISSFFLMVGISLGEGFSGDDNSRNVTVMVQVGDYQIVKGDKGQRVKMQGFSYLMVPGKPLLPARNFLIALPPGAQVRSVEVKGIGATQLPEAYRIMPTPPIIPLAHPSEYSELMRDLKREWQRNSQTVYSSDQAYPKERGKLAGSGALRKYSFASVSFYPFSYYAQSGRLIHYDSAQIIIRYSLPSLGSLEGERVEKLRWDTLADEKASRVFVAIRFTA